MPGAVGDPERPAHTVVVIGAAALILGLLEVGQKVVEAPAGVAQLAPVIEILLLAADVDQAVDRRRAAQHLAPRPGHLPAVEGGLGLGLIAPAELGVEDGPIVADRDVQPGIAIGPPGLQQQHPVGGIRGQPVGEHTAGRAGPDHDEVVDVRHLLAASLPERPSRRLAPPRPKCHDRGGETTAFEPPRGIRWTVGGAACRGAGRGLGQDGRGEHLRIELEKGTSSLRRGHRPHSGRFGDVAAAPVRAGVRRAQPEPVLHEARVFLADDRDPLRDGDPGRSEKGAQGQGPVRGRRWPADRRFRH